MRFIFEFVSYYGKIFRFIYSIEIFFLAIGLKSDCRVQPTDSPDTLDISLEMLGSVCVWEGRGGRWVRPRDHYCPRLLAAGGRHLPDVPDPIAGAALLLPAPC